LRGVYAFPIRRGEGDVGAVKQAIARLHEGYILNIFPEGTRSRTGEVGAVQRGVALVIRRANVPVIPVAIDGSFKAWPKGAKGIRSHPVRVLFGPALKIDGLKPAEIVELVETTLRRMVQQLRNGQIGAEST
jgi:1-acyl-sn-glycerol-3-phosphate acyltransferase